MEKWIGPGMVGTVSVTEATLSMGTYSWKMDENEVKRRPKSKNEMEKQDY